MPVTTPSPSAKILVTGANGFIAVWLVRELLLKGYAVRGTVRSSPKKEWLENLDILKEYKDKGLLEVVIVEDITKDGAFDEFVKDVSGIQHTASPFHYAADDPQELIVPAVRGTLSILQSALNYADPAKLKRVVVTSSCAAVLTPGSQPRVFKEEDWNEHSIKAVEEKGRLADGVTKYRASKTLAEKAAWKFVEENKDKIKWDLTVLNPPFIFGPMIHDVSTPETLNTSNQDWWQVVVTNEKPVGDLATAGACYVEVRDLAVAFVLALERPEAGGERIICSAGAFVWADFVNAVHSLAASLPSSTSGKAGAGWTAHPVLKRDPNHVHHVAYDNSKAAKIFGIKWRGINEITKGLIEDFAKRGY